MEADKSGLVFSKEYAEKLYDYSGTVEELNELLRPVTEIAKGKHPLSFMDPYTALGIIHRGMFPGDIDHRKEACSRLKEIFGIQSYIPTSFDGIPAVTHFAAMISGAPIPRDTVLRMWDDFRIFVDFAHDANHISGDDFCKAFNHMMTISSVSIGKVTDMLFWIDYEFYINLDKKNRNYPELEAGLYFPDRFDGREYLGYLKKIKDYMYEFGMDPVQFSMDAFYYFKRLESADVEYYADNVDNEVVENGTEGAKKSYYTTTYERDPKLRSRAIKIHGTKCMACGFDFQKAYGKRGKGYIEVHHIVPLSSRKEETTVDPTTDLICLCANCHRMVHHEKNHVLTLVELKEILRK